MSDDTADATGGSSGPVQTGAMAALILAWQAFPDAVLVVGLSLLSLVIHPAIVLVLAFALYGAIDLVFCTWVDRHWDSWYARAGPKVRERIDKWRGGRVMRHVVGWITSGSAFLYGLAAFLASPVVLVTIARMIGGQEAGRARVLWACAASAILFTVTVGVLAFAEDALL